MYLPFFGLRQPPFSIAPDPRYLFMSERHREALAHLLYGVGGGGGFVLLSGEIGAGKTTVCRCFLEQVPEGCQVAYIFNPKLTVTELLQSVCDEFGIAVPAAAAGQASVKTYIDALNAHLLAAHAQGRQCLLVIDEAQNLAPDVLEQLRLLTNLETSERKLLQIILIGQPELRSMLAGPGLEQLAQRVIARYHLGALSAAETAAYVSHRLAVAGLGGPLPFDAAALRRIHALTGGVPRRINLLCDRALLGAYAEGQARVGRRIVDRAAREVFDRATAPAPAGRGRWVAGVAAGGLVGAALVVVTLRLGPGLLPGGAVVAWAPASASAAPAGGVGRGGAAASAAVPSATAIAASAASALALAAPLPASAPASGAGPLLALAPGGSASAPPVSTSASPAVAPTPAAASAAGTLAAGVLPLDPVRGLAELPLDELPAWRELARLWGLPMPATGGDPCGIARARQLRCFRTATATVAQLRQLDRPGLLVLRPADGPPRYVRLAGLGAQQVVLASGNQTYSLPLSALARLWQGEFATFWQAPQGYAGLLQPGARGPAVDALAQGLAVLRQTPAPAADQVLAGRLAEALADFQRSQGMRPDGIAGPTTFMHLNRASGLVEPRLPADLPER